MLLKILNYLLKNQLHQSFNSFSHIYSYNIYNSVTPFYLKLLLMIIFAFINQILLRIIKLLYHMTVIYLYLFLKLFI